MVKLEGPSIKEFNPDKAIDLWLQKATRRPGTSASQENKVEAFQSANSNLATSEEEQAQVLLLEEPNEVAENNDNAQPGAAVLPQLGDGYQLVQVANDSDYESDYNNDDEDENEIFDIIAKY